jgi:Lar family restriction alleviation protein
MDNTLRPKYCPFCGARKVKVIYSNLQRCYYVACTICKSNGPPFFSEEMAIVSWNMRMNDIESPFNHA